MDRGAMASKESKTATGSGGGPFVARSSIIIITMWIRNIQSNYYFLFVKLFLF